MSHDPTQGPRQFCREALPGVSRTFALTIRVLPRELQDPVTVAYLLCRLADVLEDATGSDPELRIRGLEGLAQALSDSTGDPHDLAAALDGTEQLALGDGNGTRLLRDRLSVFRAFVSLAPAQREIIGRWTQAMALGMASFVDRERRRLAADAVPGSSEPGGRGAIRPADAQVPFVLDTTAELRAYAWYVAGTVGHLLTELFELHCGGKLAARERLRELAGPFGLGLQFTNILQDFAEDRRRGWSYIPEEIARAHGTTVDALDDPRARGAALRVVGALVDEASTYLDGALEYTLLLPRGTPRIRLFCLWPTFFALRTLVRIWGDEQVITGGERVRITRPEVRGVMSMTSALCLSNGALRRFYQAEKGRLLRRMEAEPV